MASKSDSTLENRPENSPENIPENRPENSPENRPENLRTDVLLYIHGLRPLAARKSRGSSDLTLWSKICKFLSSGIDDKINAKYGKVLHPSIRLERWSYLNDPKNIPNSLEEAVNLLATHIVSKFWGKRVTILGHSFGGVLALKVALKIPECRVITVASPLNGASILRLSNLLGLSDKVTQIWGNVCKKLVPNAESPLFSSDDKDKLRDRHFNIILTNPLICFDGRVLHKDQVFYSTVEGTTATTATNEAVVYGTDHTYSIALDVRVVKLVLENL